MSADSYDFAERPGDSPTSPVIFLFHGTGGDEHQFLDLAAQLLPGARRVAPRGDVSEGGAARYFRRLAEGRYDMADLGRATAKMRGFINGAIGEARPSQVVGFGYSNGANILAAVQMEDATLFDTTVLLHPLIPFEPEPQPGLAGRRVLITAGRRDPICPPPATEALADWYRKQGAELELFWHDGGHEIRQEELAAARAFLDR
ncbi:MAG TPA: alpha/beta hydrolase [Devosiaceae bacterium]|jgi:phospholipase/carboxylesterase|nr:alpha/beta hydrolase [Devosiaceae bacterium]